MPLTKEQVKQLKEQLSQQVTNLPEEQRQAALQQIEEMSDEAIESMLKQQQEQVQQQPIFRSLVSGEIPSKKVDENKDVLAVLDIKPISKGHVVIIPKKPVKESSDMPDSAFTLSKKISKKIINKLKAKGTEIQTEFKFGELIINIIPIYDKPLNLNSPREDAKDEELSKTFKLLKTEKKLPVIKQKKPKQIKLSKTFRRIP